MDKKLLKEIALEQNRSLNSLDLGIERENLSPMATYFSMPHTVVISGIRRVGKSTLLAQIINRFCKEGHYYLNFEDERLIKFEVEDFNNLYEIFVELFGEKRVFFFDEIQNAPKWEIFVRRMQDKGFKFFITGSNASLLSKELGTRLTGRSIIQDLYPFSFREFLLFQGYQPSKDALSYTSERGIIKKHFSEYLEKGGMPECLKYKDPIILKRSYEDILYRDIVARHDIKEIKALRELGLYLLSNITGLVSYNNLKRILQLGSVNTVKNYLDYMEDSFLLFTISRFSYSLKQQFVAHKKIYCIDNGLMESIAFQFSKNRGRFLENAVFLELKRKFKEIYYYKTSNNLEVDFLIREGKNIIFLIQVSGSLDQKEVRKREINALVSAMDELNLDEALILTEDNEEKIKIKDKLILVMPIYKWLLEDKTKLSHHWMF
ncbi:MAG: ATP-binding protein [Acidobacteriota bacterium]